ncbi:hypothetical protein B0T18DRAFT_386865 [Schizothecium vesticola]|uniref:Uncharacterized protein n=1 Tax=Schizothecium vesticola TaxID=314040 RepID=A0AA40KDQ9_9PEZI|nr:hypothetical protein B0T18DRAFT_386865 [Schizothecium vesticola]
MKPTRTTIANATSGTAPARPEANTPPSEDDKKIYAAETRALFAQGDKEAHAARPASLFPLSMPSWFARRKLNIQIAALVKGPLHGAFVDEFVNDVALEYIIRWDEEEKNKWPPEKEDEKKKKTTTKNKKESPQIIESLESSDVDDSPEYEPDDDDSSWSGSNTT